MTPTCLPDTRWRGDHVVCALNGRLGLGPKLCAGFWCKWADRSQPMPNGRAGIFLPHPPVMTAASPLRARFTAQGADGWVTGRTCAGLCPSFLPACAVTRARPQCTAPLHARKPARMLFPPRAKGRGYRASTTHCPKKRGTPERVTARIICAWTQRGGALPLHGRLTRGPHPSPPYGHFNAQGLLQASMQCLTLCRTAKG